MEEYLTVQYAVAVVIGLLLQYKFHIVEYLKEKVK